MINLTLISQCCSMPNTIVFLLLILKNILLYSSSSILETWSDPRANFKQPWIYIHVYQNNVSCHLLFPIAGDLILLLLIFGPVSWQHRPCSVHLYQTKSDIVPCHNYNDSPGYRNILLPCTSPIKSIWCESRIFTIVVEWIGIIIHIILTWEHYGSFRPSLVHKGRVMSEEKIFENVYRRRTPRDGISSHKSFILFQIAHNTHKTIWKTLRTLCLRCHFLFFLMI